VAQSRLTARRLLGLDRSGPPAPETLAGAPLHPWTIPNAIGFVRLALLPVFLVLALSSDDGRNTAAVIVYAVVAGTDYLDGIAARLTGQYSRLGMLIDPLTDRMLVVSGVIVCWKFELLPRWALAILAGRELFMLALSRYAMMRNVELRVRMTGRWAVWPTMASLFLAMVTSTWISEVLLYIGIALTLTATLQYLRDGYLETRPSSSA
jgi:cardiolipin synthase